ncbi:GNAT family N-acetyltransferase [Paenibacillus sp. KQZ6P-2]|uniref:GNAT family N-acetyltransferase n=2 Tax=Paenibacillus mangrovi TaxID=2931978 RepID=A0A9X1WSF1_9BACL|nr:GNAT family N-acetyltransferase [Paenibacillus mangrovi]MCJ8013856.1 GNAT family N-acetyltransferase [Paenibacillus mangrovi]
MIMQTERLMIREYQQDDFASVHRYASNPSVTKYTLWGPNTPEETKEHIDSMLAMQQQEPRVGYEFAVTLKASGEMIGGVGLHVSGANGEIGYCFHPDYWGRGYAYESACAMLELGFGRLDLHRIYATCRPENTASERVMQKLGMQKEGHLREHLISNIGGFVDSYLYSILVQERGFMK